MNDKYITFPFIKEGKILENAPLAGMTLRSASSMRFRWNEENPHRDEFLKTLTDKTFVPVELIHSHIVYDIKNASDSKNLQGDGLITVNKSLVPTVTVADCMPIFLWEENKGLFGIVHSGWKGTGIAAEAIKLANKNYGTKTEDFCLILGPHIKDCCYIVNKERADYFAENFTPDCLRPLEDGGSCFCGGRGLPVSWNNGNGPLYRLSLLKANLSLLQKAGVKRENINVIDECTCCNEDFGSNRRETAFSGTANNFTVQAAFINL